MTVFTSKSAFSGLDGKEIVDALADNDDLLLAALFGNRWHNSRFDIWQRGSSFASGASQFGPDRHRFRRKSNSAGATLSRQTGFSGAKYCTRVQRNNTNAVLDDLYLTHQFDSDEIGDFAGQSIYITADVRAGANFSAAGGVLTCRVDTGTGNNETISESAGFATGNASISDTETIGTLAARHTFGPFAIPAGMLEMAATFSFLPVGSAGAADYFEITNIRPNVGAPLLYQPIPLAIERAICERYFEVVTSGAANVYQAIGVKTLTTYMSFDIKFRVIKRAAVSLFTSSPTMVSAIPSGNQIAVYNRITAAYATPTGAVTSSTGTGVNATLLNFIAATSWNGTVGDRVEFAAGATAIVGFDAEI